MIMKGSHWTRPFFVTDRDQEMFEIQSSNVDDILVERSDIHRIDRRETFSYHDES